MTPTFDRFFSEANEDRSPFPWQRRLSDLLIAGTPPSWVTVPTGLGKTAMIDAWVHALAHSIETDGASRSVPTRLIFVVNRRGIVDDAFTRAWRLATKLLEAAPGSALDWAKQVLLASGHELTVPLSVTRMRGGVSWERVWLRQPDQPAVVTSTVDQFGSRLLFRGYGVSDKLQPIDTALVGLDTLVVLDEAHISEPLGETVRGAIAAQSTAPSKLFPCRPTKFISMTATPPDVVGSDETVLSTGDEDFASGASGKRLQAVKNMRLIHVEGEKKTADIAMAEAVCGSVSTLIALLEGLLDPTVIVIVNTVGLARLVFDQLRAKKAHDSELVVGSSRSVERIAVDETWRSRIGVDRMRLPGRPPFVLVATQTVEVGADIDADGLITEACSFDALVQRLGRLDRLGHLTEARGSVNGIVLHNEYRHNDEKSPSRGVYEHAAQGMFDFLVEVAESKSPAALTVPTIARRSPIPFDEAPSLDLGPDSLRSLIESGIPWSRVLRTPSHAPVLLPTALYGWAQTSPMPVPDRPIEPYLHGPGRGEPDVELCWRNLATAEDRDLLNALSPLSAEAVTLRISQVQRFLVQHRDEPAIESSDTTEATPEPELPRRPVARVRFALRIDGDWQICNVGENVDVGLLARSGTIVVDAAAGGHDQWAWDPNSIEPVVDVGDLVERGKPSIVVSARRLSELGFPSELSNDAFQRFEQQTRDGSSEGALAGLARDLRSVVSSLSVYQNLYLSRLEQLGERPVEVVQLGAATPPSTDKGPNRDGGEKTDDVPALVILLRAGSGICRIDPAQLDSNDDNDSTSRTARSGVLLADHLRGVGQRAHALAVGAGLDPRLSELVRRAAAFHDLGKADRRFQALLRNGDWVGAELADGGTEVLAKSAPGPRFLEAELPADMRWPKGMRHEAVTVDLMKSSTGWDHDLTPAERILVLHLAGAHHGFCRPLFPAVLDPVPSTVRVQHESVSFLTDGAKTPIDWNHPSVFRMLNEQYSPWGLAYLEALVRFADFWESGEGR